MREIARATQVFFPSQDRIVRTIASLFKSPECAKSLIVELDAGCGIKANHLTLAGIFLQLR